MPGHVGKEKFLLKPERDERRQRKKVKWQVCLSRPGGRVVRSWSQTRPLTLSLPSETELPPTMEAGVSILMSKGAEFESWALLGSGPGVGVGCSFTEYLGTDWRLSG